MVSLPPAPPAGSAVPASPPAAPGRDLVLDHARALLVVLVVLGHVLAEVPGPFARVLSVWVYAFHMPAFVFVCGYLARTYRGAPHQVTRIVTGLLVPYAVFQLVHAVIRALTLDNGFSVRFLTPSWTMWFLLALAMWRLVTPVLRALRWPLATALLMSVVAPLMEDLDQTLTLARFFSFLPFFVAGLLVTPEHLAILRSRGMRWAGLGVLGAGLVLAVVLRDHASKGVFMFSTTYADLDMDPLTGMSVRVLALACGALGTAAVLAIVPDDHRWWSFVGRRTMYVYLLHAVAINAVRHLEWPAALGEPLAVAVVIPVACVAFTLLLASPPVVALTRWLVEPPHARFLIAEDRAAAAPSGEAGQTDGTRRRSGSR